MLFIMAVTLYTSRVVLSALGVIDFGIHNVVGGLVSMMSFFNGSMSTATQRFLNYEIGRSNQNRLCKIFSTSFISYCIVIVLVVFIAETVGIWFVENKLNLPDDRKNTAFGVYQLSILSFVFGIISAPYNATIIAHERMSAFAYIGIIEALLKLAIAYLITISHINKLLFYAILLCCMSLITCFIYILYSTKHFKECRLQWVWDTDLLKKMFSFSGWMLAGTLSKIFSTQGVNLLINLFFGPIYNATRSIAIQVYNAVDNFILNFMMAAKPQIIKSYAKGDFDYSYRLIFSTSRLSFYLLFILSVTILFETEFILCLWLKTPPQSAYLFTRLVILDLFLTVLYGPIATVSQASGKVKNYQLSIAVCFILIFLITYFMFKLNYPVYSTFVVLILVDAIGLFVRLYILKRDVNFPSFSYINKVVFPVCLVFCITIIPCYFIYQFIDCSSILCFLLKAALYVSCSVLVICTIGLNHSEKKYTQKIIVQYLKK